MNTQVAQRGRDRAGQRRVRRAIAPLFAVVVVLLAGSVLGASPAAAHATVSRSEPADQARLTAPPSSVTVWFSEAVSPSVGGMTVINQAGAEVQSGVHQPSGDSLMAMLPADLPHGTYVATYRIISEDGHPITGSLVFGVGETSLADVSGLTQETDASIDALSKAGQFLVYLGALAAAGIVFFLTFLYGTGGPAAERRRLDRLVRVGAAVAVVGALVVLLAQTAQATGAGLGAVFDLDNLQGVLRQGLGAQDAGILVGLALLLVALRLPPGGAARVLSAVGGLATAGSFVLWGHAIEGTDTWLTLPADIVHLVVAAVWFGGLVGLAVVLRARRVEGPAAVAAGGGAIAPEGSTAGPVAGTGTGEATETGDAGEGAPVGALRTSGTTATAVLDDPAPGDGGASFVVGDRARAGGEGRGGTGGAVGGGGPGDAGDGSPLAGTVGIVRRFSAAAFVSLLVLTAAGVALGLVEMGGLGTVFSTAYGRLLLAKLAVVAVVAAAAGYNRFFLLPWLLTDGPAPDGDRQAEGWRTLRSTVRFEALAIVGVLALTAVLTNTTPGGTPAKAAPSTPLEQTQPMDGGTATVYVSPNRPGSNSMHVDVKGADGRPLDVVQVEVEFTLAAKSIGPIIRETVHGGPGHYMLEGTSDLSIAGDWSIDVVVRIDEFDEERLTFQDSIS
jgi:copper transport protein